MAAETLETLGDFNLAIDGMSIQEKVFMTEFPALIGRLVLPELMVPVGKRGVAHPEMFSLIPIMSKSMPLDSMEFGGYTDPEDPNVLLTRGKYKKPYLDTQRAIGLARIHQPYDDVWPEGMDRWLIAVSGAGVTPDGKLFVKQFQDTTGVQEKDDRHKYLRTGLHSGYLWRHTFLKAWELIAADIGSPTVVVMSHLNSVYDPVIKNGYKGYDQVAKDMGYSSGREDSYGINWEKAVSIPRN